MPTLLNVTTVCTAYQLASFQYDRNFVTEQNAAAYKKDLEAELTRHLNTSKAHQKACVFAFLTMEQSVNFEVLENLGFVRTFDAHNYKYPNTSKRLIMFTKDMNDWAVAPKKPQVQQANPFQITPTTQPVANWLLNPVVINRVTVGNCEYTIGSHPDSIRRRALHNFDQAPRNYFPVGQWVDVPRNTRQCPPGLAGTRIDLVYWNNQSQSFVHLHNIGVEGFIWTGWHGHYIARIRRLS